MKTIRLHPVSLLVGLAGGVGALLLMSQSPLTTLPTGRVEVGPHPRDMVHIDEGSTFTVPTGKYFVLTGLGRVEQPGFAVLRVNGQNEVSSYVNYGSNGAYWSSSQNSTTVVPAPQGFTAQWGATIEVMTPGVPPHDGRAWGYLADR